VIRSTATFTWTGNTTATSGGALQVGFNGAKDANYSLTIFVPAGANTVTAPVLPTDAAAAFAPSTASLDAYFLPSYACVAGPGFTAATLRQAAFASVNVAENGLEQTFASTPMPVDGTYRMTTFRVLSL